MNSNQSTSDPNLVGGSDAFLQALEIVKQVAPTAITVMITGESGTGKEMFAQAIHNLSDRAQKPLVTVNCGAIPEGILESELFGHEKGAFTGAVEARKGFFETAHQGTIFLDEIGELPLATQVKLLRVLEDKSFMRVGGSKTIRVDVRVIAATNRNLESAVKRGEFRHDLFYRLNAVKIQIPPLRERRDDIRPLIDHFSREVCQENHIDFKGFTEDAYDLLEDYSWPGNIRELRNLVERVIVLERGHVINQTLLLPHLNSAEQPDRYLPVLSNKTTDQAERELIYRALLDLRMAVEEIRASLREQSVSPFGTPVDHPGNEYTDREDVILPLKEYERQHIEKALHKYRGNRRKAARALEIGERTLYRKLKEYGLE